MPGRPSLLSALLLSLMTLTSNMSAQTSSLTSPANSKVEVLYLQQNSNILTYNVDPSNAKATLVGQPLITAAAPLSLSFPAKDRFLYILGTDAQNNQHIWVYATDSLGVPRTPALQDLNAAGITQFQVDPNGKFAYAVDTKTDPDGDKVSDLRLFVVNEKTGTLTESPTIQGRYPPSYYCGPGLNGFSSDGSKLYVIWGCSYPDSQNLAYYYRNIDPATGALSPGTQFFRWQNGNEGADEVAIAGNVFFDLHDPISFEPQYNVLNIYPLTVGPKKPLIRCTSKMLQACQDAGSIRIDPLGRYVFLSVLSGYEIAKVDWASQRIVDTGNSLSDMLQLYFSPDEQLLYGVQYGAINSQSTAQFYKFDKKSGTPTLGDSVTQNALYNAFPAERW